MNWPGLVTIDFLFFLSMKRKTDQGYYGVTHVNSHHVPECCTKVAFLLVTRMYKHCIRRKEIFQ